MGSQLLQEENAGLICLRYRAQYRVIKRSAGYNYATTRKRQSLLCQSDPECQISAIKSKIVDPVVRAHRPARR